MLQLYFSKTKLDFLRKLISCFKSFVRKIILLTLIKYNFFYLCKLSCNSHPNVFVKRQLPFFCFLELNINNRSQNGIYLLRIRCKGSLASCSAASFTICELKLLIYQLGSNEYFRENSLFPYCQPEHASTCAVAISCLLQSHKERTRGANFIYW